MEFTSWIDYYVQTMRLLPEHDRQNGVVKLSERNSSGADMSVQVEGVPNSAVVVCAEACKNWVLFNSNRLKDWSKCCDYLIIGHIEHSHFALFVELKTKVSDKTGCIQLYWSQPLLSYFLSVYNLDQKSNLCESEFKVLFWQISSYPRDDFVTSATYLGENEPSSSDDSYRNLTIHNKVAAFMQFEELLRPSS